MSRVNADFNEDYMLSLLKEAEPRYSEPHRHYHTWRHIEHLLGCWVVHKDFFHNWTAAFLAIIYHDIVYDPAGSANEEASDLLFKIDVAKHFPDSTSELVSKMILATKKHELPAGDTIQTLSDIALFLDMDMCILASPQDLYDWYEDGIAKEYVPVYGREAYVKGRLEVLTKFLERKHIFLSAPFQRYEEKAVLNLKGAIADLALEASLR